MVRGSRGDQGQIVRGLDGNRNQLVRPYSRIVDRGAIGSLGRLDGRSAQGRMVRHLEAELVAHIGGDPTIAQQLLIERIVKMKLQIDALEEKLTKGDWTPHDQRIFSGLTNAYRLTIRELDQMKRRKPRIPSLEEVLERRQRP